MSNNNNINNNNNNINSNCNCNYNCNNNNKYKNNCNMTEKLLWSDGCRLFQASERFWVISSYLHERHELTNISNFFKNNRDTTTVLAAL